MSMKKNLLFVFSLVMTSFLFAQKKPLDHSVYDSWQRIGERMISNDGKWVVYTIDPQEGDNELVIQSSDAKYKKSVARGYNALITEDSRYVVFKIKPFYKDTREAKIRKKKPDDFPKDSLAIIELGKEEVWKTSRVKAYKTPQKGYGWMAYHLEKPLEQPQSSKSKNQLTTGDKKITDSLNKIIDSLNAVIRSIPAKKKKGRDDDELIPISESGISNYQDADGDETTTASAETGTDLVLRKMETGNEKIFNNVLEFYFNKTGQKLLIETSRNPKDSLSKAIVLLYDLEKGLADTLSRGGNDFKNFAMTDDGSQVAYTAERDAKPKDLQKFYRLWYFKKGMDSASLLVDKNSVGMKLGMTISENGAISFSKTGKRLFFGTAPIQPPKDTTLVEFEHPKVDIWHYNDDYLQTVQTFPARLQNDLKENFLAVYDLNAGTVKQLGSKEVPQVIQTNEGDGDIFIGVTDFGKRIESQWTGNTKKDIYTIDVETGTKKLVKENMDGQVYPSSTGKYILWYDRHAKNYFVWDGVTTRNITAKIKVPLWNESSEVPEDPGPYGVMGWHEGDSTVYVYDKYDVWKVDVNGKSNPRNVTGFGRLRKQSYRYLRVNEEERYLKSMQPVLFRTQLEKTKESGIVEGSLNSDLIMSTPLSEGSYSFNAVMKSKNSHNFIYTKENFIESPNIYFNPGSQIIGMNQNVRVQINEQQLSSINSQQKDYNWGTAELVKWKAYNGKEATGIVYKPEDFNPKKKYPLICYFYETLSDNLNTYHAPAPIRSAINIPFFVSRGYIIFLPDIHYTTGHPGKNAYDYVVSGARALVKKGFVDSTNMAIQGHSWGGYQVAQIVTMTKLFKAAWAGAPVANMTSAYGGIRWESGVNRQFQYEKSQSRIGATLWQKPQLYIENSPLFHLDKVTTPLVIMANDADGAVPWYQGIELFTAMRRLGKKIWMFNYNGQGHGLTQRQDMRDYQIRMQQFFDWILKGEKPAKWIIEGVPAVKKGKDWGLEIE
jgi:dipeptidyl aminopeptidase/acylaminoacyl peptidase